MQAGPMSCALRRYRPGSQSASQNHGRDARATRHSDAVRHGRLAHVWGNWSGRLFQSALAGLLLFLGASGPAARAADADEIRQLREQLRALEQRLDELEKKQERSAAEATAAAQTAPKVSVSDKGFSLASADSANAIRLRALVQVDSRLFFQDGGLSNNAFVLRRARFIAEGTINKIYDFQIVPEYAGSSVTVLDANLAMSLSPAAQLKFGRFKPPIGLELLQSDAATFFAERSLVTNFLPNRDLGAQLGGNVLDGAVIYTAGVFNGVADGANTSNADFDNDKDAVGRVFVQPFKSDASSLLQGLGFGAAGSRGRQKTAAALTSGYKTDGQQVFFRYNSATIADGPSWRVSPQAYYYRGPFGVLGEYAVSAVDVRTTTATAKTELHHHAWQLVTGYMLTGEKSAYSGVLPAQPFRPGEAGWGAWEVTARFANLKIDHHAFPLFSDPAASAAEATAWGVGVNWYLNKTVRATFDYFRTRFDTILPSTSVLLRQDEQALITRLQLAF
jgi:phosphate-selective porin OprO/OprP